MPFGPDAPDTFAVADFLRTHGYRLARPKPIKRTGKSAVYLLEKRGRQAILKVLTLKEDPWKALFRNEAKVYREIKSAGYGARVASLACLDSQASISVWKFVAGRSVGQRRYFRSDLSLRQSQRLLGSIQWVTDVRRERLKREDAQAITALVANELGPGVRLPSLPAWKVFAHGDLLASNILFDRDTVHLLDWEHAGPRLPLFDIAFLWVVGMRSKSLRRLILQKPEVLARPDLFWVNALQIIAHEVKLHRPIISGAFSRAQKSEARRILAGLGASRLVARRGLQDALG